MTTFLDRIMAHKFTDEDILNVFEIARFALNDAETFDNCANGLDLSDSFMDELREKIEKVTGGIDI